MMTLIADIRQAFALLARERWFAAGGAAALVLAVGTATWATGSGECARQAFRTNLPLQSFLAQESPAPAAGWEAQLAELEEKLAELDALHAVAGRNCSRRAAVEARRQSVAASLTGKCTQMLERLMSAFTPSDGLSSRG